MSTKIKGIFREYRWQIILSAASLAVIVLHLILRAFPTANLFLLKNFVSPLENQLSILTSHFSISIAECEIALVILSLSVWAVLKLRQGIIKKQLTGALIRIATVLLSAVLLIYSGFSILWGTFYYSDDFITTSGFTDSEITVEQLATVTDYFAQLANDYSVETVRNKSGECSTDREEILHKSESLYDNIVREYSFLDGPRTEAKGIKCSKILSLIDFTGFYFPFTGEANVNMDFPVALLPATVAHELAHQRGVAKEQEANFVAVLASLASQDSDYCYSASLLAFIHLGNALYSVSPEQYKEIYSGLNDYVRKDLTENNTYWANYKTPVKSVSNKIYEGFLESYDQNLGLKSYGACVDLLVNYYYPLIQSDATASYASECN